MAPAAKRKRPDGAASKDDTESTSRPSPHKPEALGLADRDRYSGEPIYHPLSGMALRPSLPVTNESLHAEENTQLNRKSDNAPPTTISTGEIPAPGPESLNPSHIAYDIIDDACLRSWAQQGKDQVIQQAVSAIQSDDVENLDYIFQEIIQSGLEQRLDPAEAGRTVKAIINAASEDAMSDGEHPEAAIAFTDTLSVVADAHTSNPNLKRIVMATGISPALLREQLEEPLLQALGLIRSTFGRVFIRKQTNILYRQSNYNLLREETEGFSKLMTELFTVTNSEQPSEETVTETFENIKALIGAFDLDAGRVLDVTLDVFASLLVKHYRFFVKYLRASSYWPQTQRAQAISYTSAFTGGLPLWAQPGHSNWTLTDDEVAATSEAKERRDTAFWDRARAIGMDAYFELAGCEILDPQEKEAEHARLSQASDPLTLETARWIEITGARPPPGNAVAAQLLGFKLKLYASGARDDELPVNLIYLAALLIKIGFISIKDLYGHLYPTEEGMNEVKQKQMAEKEEREKAKRPGAGALNALARAGALTAADDPPVGVHVHSRAAETRAPTPKPATPTVKDAVKGTKREDPAVLTQRPGDPQDQKVQLLRSLLLVGALPEALYMLGRFPWLPDAFPDLPEYIHRLLRHSLSKVYASCNPVPNQASDLSPATSLFLDQAGQRRGAQSKEVPVTPLKTLRWPKLDKAAPGEGHDYHFYWDDWFDNVPVCQTMEDVFTLCSSLLNLSGIKIGQDPLLMKMLARMGKYSVTLDKSEGNLHRWLDLCKRILCPALSLAVNNNDAVQEVFELLSHYPTKERFSVYAEWFQGSVIRTPDIANAFALVKAHTRDLLKRMDRTNTKPMARKLTSISCNAPAVAFGLILDQILAYENFTEVIVDCARYFGYMAYDVLTWSVMIAIGSERRSRVSETGFGTSPWFQRLCVFAGKAFKRYSHMDPFPLLQYTLKQVQAHNVSNLDILKELMSGMAGVMSDNTLSEAQILAMAAGRVLKGQTLRQIGDQRHEQGFAYRRLMKNLTEHNLVAPFFIAIAQECQMHIFDPVADNNKIASEVFDSTSKIMAQYIDMLDWHMPPDEIARHIPDLISLISDFGVRPATAFNIHRRSLGHTISNFNRTSASNETAPKPSESRDIEMTDAPDTSAQASESSGTGNNVVEKVKSEEQPDSKLEVDQKALSSVAEPESPWHPVLRELMSKFKSLLPPDFEDSLSISFYLTFWQLSLTDIMAPPGYEEEITRLRQRPGEPSTSTSADAMPKDSHKKGTTATIENLMAEMKGHVLKRSEVNQRLAKEKSHWFTAYITKPLKLNTAILQECFLPRLVYSAADAYYVQKMLFHLHASGTPGFRTMFFLDRLLGEKTVANVIYQCTSLESENFGRFLSEVLNVLTTWHKDRSVYQKKAHGQKKELPGFANRILKDGTPDNLLDFEDFRRLFYKWHRNLLEALKTCLSDWEYMHIRNACNVLKAVSKHFPMVDWMGNRLIAACDAVVTREQSGGPLAREDVRTIVDSTSCLLKSTQKRWVLPQAFQINNAPQRGRKTSDSAAASKVSQPSSNPPKSSEMKISEARNEASLEPVTKVDETDQVQTQKTDLEDGEEGEVRDTVMADVGETNAGPAEQPTSQSGKAKETTQDGLEKEHDAISGKQMTGPDARETQKEVLQSTVSQTSDSSALQKNDTKVEPAQAPDSSSSNQKDQGKPQDEKSEVSGSQSHDAAKQKTSWGDSAADGLSPKRKREQQGGHAANKVPRHASSSSPGVDSRRLDESSAITKNSNAPQGAARDNRYQPSNSDSRPPQRDAPLQPRGPSNRLSRQADYRNDRLTTNRSQSGDNQAGDAPQARRGPQPPDNRDPSMNSQRGTRPGHIGEVNAISLGIGRAGADSRGTQSSKPAPAGNWSGPTTGTHPEERRDDRQARPTAPPSHDFNRSSDGNRGFPPSNVRGTRSQSNFDTTDPHRSSDDVPRQGPRSNGDRNYPRPPNPASRPAYQKDPSYGRLNAEPMPPPRHESSNFSDRAARNQHALPTSPSEQRKGHERPHPSNANGEDDRDYRSAPGPSYQRQTRNIEQGQRLAPSAEPTTDSPVEDMSGIHPSRRRQFEDQPQAPGQGPDGAAGNQRFGNAAQSSGQSAPPLGPKTGSGRQEPEKQEYSFKAQGSRGHAAGTPMDHPDHPESRRHGTNPREPNQRGGAPQANLPPVNTRLHPSPADRGPTSRGRGDVRENENELQNSPAGHRGLFRGNQGPHMDRSTDSGPLPMLRPTSRRQELFGDPGRENGRQPRRELLPRESDSRDMQHGFDNEPSGGRGQPYNTRRSRDVADNDKDREFHGSIRGRGERGGQFNPRDDGGRTKVPMPADPYGPAERGRNRDDRGPRADNRDGYGMDHPRPQHMERQPPNTRRSGAGPPPPEEPRRGGSNTWVSGGGRGEMRGAANDGGRERRSLPGRGEMTGGYGRKRDWPGDGPGGPESSKRPKRGGQGR